MKNREFFKPQNTGELRDILGQHKENAVIIAGGTNIIPDMQHERIDPSFFIDISDIKDLSYVHKEGEMIHIGAATTFSDLEANPIIQDYPSLWTAIHEVGSPVTRNRATIGGNLADAAPCADSAPPLLALEAHLRIINSAGELRDLPLDQFFLEYKQTALRKDEFIESIIVPKMNQSTQDVFIKVGFRNAMAIAAVGFAMAFEEEAGICKKVRIGLGSVAPIPLRAYRTEQQLEGQNFSEELLESCSQTIQEEISPINDIRGSIEYRYHVTSTLFKSNVRKFFGVEESNDTNN